MTYLNPVSGQNFERCPCYTFVDFTSYDNAFGLLDDNGINISRRTFTNFLTGGLMTCFFYIPKSLNNSRIGLVWSYKNKNDYYELRVENMTIEYLPAVYGFDKINYTYPVPHYFLELNLYRYVGTYLLLDSVKFLFFHDIYDNVYKRKYDWEDNEYKKLPVSIQTFPRGDGGTVTLGQVHSYYFGYSLGGIGRPLTPYDRNSIATVKTNNFIDIGLTNIGISAYTDINPCYYSHLYAGETGDDSDARIFQPFVKTDTYNGSHCPQLGLAFRNTSGGL